LPHRRPARRRGDGRSRACGLGDRARAGVPRGALHAGGLALGQMHALARRAGVPEPEIDAALPRWCALHAELYLARLAETDTSGWQAAPGAEETLTELQARARLALLTGNAEPIARARMERLGLARFFPEGQGA